MNKKIISVLILVVIGSFAWWYHSTDYGTALPTQLPSAVPIIDGKIVASREAIFEDGKGYIIEIESPRKFDDAIEYYKTAFGKTGTDVTFRPMFSLTESSQEQMMSGEAFQGSNLILLEVLSRGDSTFVTTAVHMRKWFLP
jgi:hypothetical protein